MFMNNFIAYAIEVHEDSVWMCNGQGFRRFVTQTPQLGTDTCGGSTTILELWDVEQTT